MKCLWKSSIGIVEVTASNPVEALIFFRLLPSNCLNWKICCDDHSSLLVILLQSATVITKSDDLYELRQNRASYVVHYRNAECSMHFWIAAFVEKCHIIVLPFFYVIIAIGIISWAYYKLFQTIKQCKSEITSSGHRRDLGLNVPEVKITKSLFPAS